MAMDAVEQGAIAPMLERIIGRSGVCHWADLDAVWQTKLTHAIAPGSEVACLVSPHTVEELAELVACAHHHRWQIIPCGAGSKLHWGGLVGRQHTTSHQPPPASQQPRPPLIALSTQGLNRLVEHAVGDLTVTVEAGMRFTDLQAGLAKAGQFLAIDPLYPEQATIGGIIATADTGSLRQRYHSVRDLLLGVALVRADGQVAKAGGRVVKNVAGYDLMKLFTGSYGTLGILTQVTFRVHPLPEAAQTVILSGANEAIAQATQTILSSALTPTSIDILSASVVETLQLGQGTGLAVRFQSLAASVEEQAQRVLQMGQALGLASVVYTDDNATTDESTLWRRVPEQMTALKPGLAITCKIGIRPTAAIALLHHIAQLSLPTTHVQIHAASGLGRLTIAGAVRTEHLMKIRAFCQTHQGFLSILDAPLAIKQQLDPWGYTGNALNVMKTIKHQFDPNQLLSPGRFVGGI